MDRLVDYFSRRKKPYFSDKKKLVKVTTMYLSFQSVENLRSIKCLLWHIVPKRKTSEVSYQM